MQDIDFDEIDRAVSSTMSAPKSSPSVDDSTEDTKIAVTTTRSTPPVAPRPTSGRFMDVVHPSSDMKPAERVTPRPEVPADASETSLVESAWPDPLDFHGFKLDEEPVKPTKVIEEEPKVAAPSEEDEPLAPLETPFLSDAKVEKRPLGAFSTAESTPPSIEDESVEEPKPQATELPTEESTPQESTPVLQDEEPEETPVERPSLEGASVTPAEEEPISGPTSITQQYKEQPVNDDNPSGAIYDTESYHAPLTHTPKKSSALVILWIVALIVLGGGIGALAYFFVLPNL